jgi:hypothetical protein
MYKYQNETVQAYRKIKEGTVAQKEMELGLHNYEPLIVAMDSMLRYAKAFKKNYEGLISEDGVLGEYYLDIISGIRGLLNGQGAVAMEKDMSGDTKDNGAIEELFWKCMDVGGYEEKDL